MKLSIRPFLFSAVLLILGMTLALPGAAQALDPVPIPTVTGPITLPSESHAFGAADHSMVNIDLAAAGYVQEEYFVSGKANVYDWFPGTQNSFATKILDGSNTDYTTRILVFRPANPAHFSGNVVVEWVNPTNTWDLARMWYACWGFFLRHGDIYVGLTAKPVAAFALQVFDPVRYAALNWKQPLPGRCHVSGASFDASEDGLIWDIGSQVAALLKSPSTPLRGFQAKHVYATGHSQTASYLNTYINFFHKVSTMPDGSTVHDGYLLHGGGGLTKINQCAASISDSRVILQGSSAPIMRFQSYTDWNGGALAARRADGDAANDRYRLYELAGPSHNWLYAAYFPPSEDDLDALVGDVPGAPNYFNHYFQTIYRCTEEGTYHVPTYANDFPSHYLINGAYENMYRWVEEGALPPKADRIHTRVVFGKTVAVLDQFGNPVGGVRTPYLDVPTATYTPGPAQDKPAFAGSGKCGSWGSMIPFSRDQLKTLYKNHGQYVSKIAQGVNDLVRNGWITQEDAAQMKTAAAQSPVPDASPALIKPEGTLYTWPDTYPDWVNAGRP